MTVRHSSMGEVRRGRNNWMVQHHGMLGIGPGETSIQPSRVSSVPGDVSSARWAQAQERALNDTGRSLAKFRGSQSEPQFITM